MIGDGENDIKAGIAVGCKTVLLNGKYSDRKEGDFGQVDTVSDLTKFVEKYFCELSKKFP